MRSVPLHWVNDRIRTADIFCAEGICAGIAMALDVCEREKNIYEMQQEYPFNLHEEVDAALEFLAKYAKWQEMGAMLTEAQCLSLLRFVYVGQDPKDHYNEFFYSWER